MNQPLSTTRPPRAGDRVLDDLFEQITAKVQAGEPVDVEAYVRDFPELAERIRQLVPAIEALAELGLSAVYDTSGAPRPATGEPVTGLLGDFRILREIGRGGMGIVYEAEQVSLGRRVALKVLPFAAVLDPKQLQRFKNEAQAAASLDHPNIVDVLSVGCERGVHYYAMKYIEGQTLAEVIGQMSGVRDQGSGVRDQGSGVATSVATPSRGASGEGPEERVTGRRGDKVTAPTATDSPPHPVTPSPPQAAETQPAALLSTEGSTRSPEFFRSVARLGIQAAEALEHAHGMGVVHRDIKPSNLMVESRLPSPARGRGAGGEGRGGEAPHLWITDFGLAMTQTDTNLTMTGDLLGTLRYMSPEQVEAKHGVLDHRTDVYSLGVTLYELLTLQPAFPGDDRQRLMRQVAEDDPRPPRQLNRAIPGDLETIILKATAKGPESRYATAQELADDLRRVLEHKPIWARRPTVLQRTAKWSRRHRPLVWSLAGAAGVALVALAVSVVLVLGAYEREKSQRQESQEHLRLAMDAVDQVYLKFAGGHYGAFAARGAERAEPFTPEDERILQKIVLFYQQFTDPKGRKPSQRHEAVEACRRIGMLRYSLKMPKEGIAACSQAVEIAERLTSEFPHVRQYRDGLARAHEDRSYGYFAVGDLDLAIAGLDEAIRLLPDHAPFYANRGYLYSEKGDFDQAMTDVDEAIGLDSKNSYAHGLKGDFLFRGRKLDEAIAAYDRALQIDPDSQPFPALNHFLAALNHFSRGNIFAKRREFQRAIDDYTEALNIEADFHAAFHNRGSAYAETGQLDKAIDDYRQALRVDPTSHLSYHARGRMYLKQRRFPQALEDFEKALEHTPQRGGGGLNNLTPGQIRSDVAWLLATCPDTRLRDPGRAVQLATEALKFSPFVKQTLGVSRYRVGDWQGSIEVLEKSTKDACSWSFLAMAYWQLGEKQQARQWYDKAVERLANLAKPPDVRDVKMRLAPGEKFGPEPFRRFVAEAAELLGIDDAQAQTDPSTDKQPGEYADHMIFAWSAWQDPIL